MTNEKNLRELIEVLHKVLANLADAEENNRIILEKLANAIQVYKVAEQGKDALWGQQPTAKDTLTGRLICIEEWKK